MFIKIAQHRGARSSHRLLLIALVALGVAGVGAAAASANDAIQWLATPEQPGALQSHDMEADAAAENVVWQGRITSEADPYLILNDIQVNADANKWLIVEGTTAGSELQLYFAAPGGHIGEQASVRVGGIDPGALPGTLIIDLSKLAVWKGPIGTLRLDPAKTSAGAQVRLTRVGAAASAEAAQAAVAADPGNPVQLVEAVNPGAQVVKDMRMALWQHTMAMTEETHGLSGLATYQTEAMSYVDAHMLARFLPAVTVAGREATLSEARGVRVWEEPGKVMAVMQCAGVTVTTELVPLLVGEDQDSTDGLPVDGAVLYRVRTEPTTPLSVRIGEGGLHNKLHGKTRIGVAQLDQSSDTVTLEGEGTALITSPRHGFNVVVRTTATLTSDANIARADAASGAMDVVVGYSKDAAQARQHAAIEPAAGMRTVAQHYATLMQSSIDTPDDTLDAAFHSALYNLEYTWVAPFGWVESPHHWLALWHMQQTAAADWLGQQDRAKLCIETHARAQMDNGDIPHMMMFYHRRRDFGGHNQYWAWQVRHYLRQTGDKAFAAQMAPVMDRMLAATRAEHDADGNGLLGWGLQIGNQEDFCATPHDGTTPTIEWINMWHTRAEIARALDDQAGAQAAEAEAARSRDMLRRSLWMPELGRFMHYRDALGTANREGLYHAYTYPASYGIVDALDGYTSMRHVADRLTDRSGAIYASNLFSVHAPGTWGMQMGVAQQPWASLGWSKLGQTEQAARPLQAAATWVMDGNKRGSWPEVSSETWPALFSPPIGPFFVALIEGVYGLQPDMANERLTISPCFPSSWPHARLTLPEWKAEFTRTGTTLRYTVSGPRAVAQEIRWPLPVCTVTRFTANGKAVSFGLEPGVGGVWLTAVLPAMREVTLELEYAPIECTVNAPASVAEGDPLPIEVRGASIRALHDRSGLLASMRQSAPNRVLATVKTGLLDEGLQYGRLGQLNEAGRTLFLDCEVEDTRFTLPVNMMLLPRLEAAVPDPATLTDDLAVSFTLQVRNNAATALQAAGEMRVAGQALPLAIEIPARSEVLIPIVLPATAALLSPGDNRAELIVGHATLALTLDAARLGAARADLAAYAAARLTPIAIPEGDTIEDSRWREVRNFQGLPHFSSNPVAPMETLGTSTTLNVPGIAGLRFEFAARRFVPVSLDAGRTSWEVKLHGSSYKKLYLLVIPFLDNHTMYAPVARVSVRTSRGSVIARTLYSPGDLDWWWSKMNVGQFATQTVSPGDGSGRAGRLGLLPLLPAGAADWAEGQAPRFAEPEFWAQTRDIDVGSSVMNVIELDLGQPMSLAQLIVESIGRDAALGVVGVVGERVGGSELLTDERLLPPVGLREPRAPFGPLLSGRTDGWQLEGTAFSVAPVPALFGQSTLNSLAAAGESATGKARSPRFKPEAGEIALEFEFQGGRPQPLGEGHTLELRLLDVETGAVLQRLPAPGNHTPQAVRIDLRPFTGRALQVELSDADAGQAYAWIGAGEFRLLRQP